MCGLSFNATVRRDGPVQASRSHQDRPASGVRGRLRGLLGRRGTLAPPADLPWVRPCRLLRQLPAASRNRSRQRQRPCGHPFARTGGGVELVLHRPDSDAHSRGRGADNNPYVTSWRIRAKRPGLGTRTCGFGPARARAIRASSGGKSGWGEPHATSLPLGSVDMTQTCVVGRSGRRGQCM